MARKLSRLVWFLFLLLAVADARAADTYQWPQWQGPDRNGLTEETGLLKEWPEGGPKRLWMFENCGTGYSGPAVVDGRLYTMGARDGTCLLLALDANTGEELWAREVGPELENDWGNGPRATPTVAGNFVYALGGRGTLVCVRARNGKEIWRTSMEDLGGKVPVWGYTESVLVDGKRVLCTPGGEQGAVAALDKATGRPLWQAKDVNDEAHYSSIIRAEFHGEPQYVQLLLSRVVGIAPDDGRVLWQSEFPGSVAVIPTPQVLDDDQVFVTSGYGAGCKLVKIGPDNTAEVVYESKLMKNHHGGVLRVGDYLYGYSDGVGWVCMDFRTGEEKWKERDIFGKGAIAYADGMFYCLGEDDGTVVLIDASPEGWKEHGRFTLDPQTQIRKDRGKIWTHPVIVNGKLYLRDQDHVYCYDVRGE